VGRSVIAPLTRAEAVAARRRQALAFLDITPREWTSLSSVARALYVERAEALAVCEGLRASGLVEVYAFSAWPWEPGEIDGAFVWYRPAEVVQQALF